MPGAGAGAGAVSWPRTLVQGAGAGAVGVARICEGVYFRIFFPDSEAMGFLIN